MQAQLKNLTGQFEDIVGTVRTRIVDTNEYVADTVSPYIENISESVSKTADNVSEQFTKTVEKLDLPNIDLPNIDLKKIDVPFADKLPARSDLPSITLPEVPAASKIVDSTFNFVSESVEANRKFVTDLVEAWTPAADEPATKSPTKKPAAKKAAAKKSTAKKSASTKSATKVSAKK